MSVLPKDFLPPADSLPKKIYPLPESQQLPANLNIVDYCIYQLIQ
jgi:hypothetical protein